MRKLVYFIIAISLFSCKEEGTKAGDNPFNGWGDNDTINKGYSDKPMDTSTIVQIHRDIFLPTCANSGCHDGLFEPDFRTIESSYNSLIYNGVIKNTVDSAFTYRVVPGNAAMSMLVERMKVDLNGNSGIMPIALDEGSDWLQKKDQYIQNIETWINNGAKDQFGNPPTDKDFPPQLAGLIGFYGGGTSAKRPSAYRSITVPASAGGVELWVAYTDDKTSVSNFTDNTLKYTINPYGWDSAKVVTMQIQSTPKIAKGYSGEDVKHYHKVYIPFTGYQAEDVLWVRTFVSDGVNDTREVPNDNSLMRAKEYFTIKLK